MIDKNFLKENYLLFKYINLKIIFIFLNIFKLLKIKLIGLDIKIKIKKKNIINILYILKQNSSFLFKVLTDLIIEDFPKNKKRFIIKYYIKSSYNKILQIILKTTEFKPVFSILNIYKSAFWLEREAWDLYGIFFFNNKDLRRLLTDYGFKGNPFKKDFPLTGYLEIYFDFFWKKLKYKKINT